MPNREFLRIFFEKWRFVLAFVILITVASFVLTIIQTPEHKTTAQLLVIQQNRADMDSYTAAKSAEQITNTFSKVIYTGSFMQRVFQGGYNVKDDFGDTAEQKQKNWRRAIKLTTEPDTGFLKIEVYRSDRGQSWLLTSAITDILTKNNSDYHGGGDKIQVSIVDPPTISDRIARPNIWQNTLIGACLGLLVGVILVAVFKEELRIDDFLPVFSRGAKGTNEDLPNFTDKIFAAQESIEPTKPKNNFAAKEKPAVKAKSEASGIGAPPVGLPIIETETVAEPKEADVKTVAEGETVEISPEEQAAHWLETGEIKK